MKQLAIFLRPALVAGLVFMAISALPSLKPIPKMMPLEAGGRDYLPLLQGPPETVSMRSGLVVLAPGKSVGKHSTETNEEMLVVLEGQGQMRVTGGDLLSFAADTALYCPPNTEHDVVNTGTAPLRYVYVVSAAAGR